MSDQERDILTTLAQGRDAKAKNVEAKIKVTPESAFSDSLLQIAAGGSQDTNVNGDAARASHGTDFLFLNGAQKFGLKVDRKFADFVEEYGSAFGDGQQSVFGLVGTGKRSTDIPEQLAFNHRGAERAGVDGNERLVAKRSGVMDGTRDHFFSRATFTKNQYGM